MPEQLQINDTINRIIQRRRTERLPQIEVGVENLVDVKTRLEDLKQTLDTINNQIEQQRGAYYSMVQDNPGMKGRLAALDVESLINDVNFQIEQLELLRKRFSREAVQIGLVGQEGSGKSRFLQSMTGLPNRVIPSFGGASCTGAVSVIHNQKSGLQTQAHVSFYCRAEMLEIVRSKIASYNINVDIRLNSIDSLGSISNLLPKNIDDVEQRSDYKRFCKSYIEHYNEYFALLDCPPVSITDEKEIIKYVSQYEEFPSIPEDEDSSKYEYDQGRNVYIKYYYLFLAVKNVEIFAHFPDLDEAKIVLCDTVGLGASMNAAKVEKEMYRVLREECDAAVDVYRPEPQRGLSSHQRKILNKISSELSDRDTGRWLVCAINKVTTGVNQNVSNAERAKEEIMEEYKNVKNPIINDCVSLDASDAEQVRVSLLIPILNIVSQNLDQIDTDLVEQSEKDGYKLFLKYKELYTEMKSIVTHSIKGDNMTYMTLSPHIESTKNELLKKLNELDDQYRKNKDGECAEVVVKLDTLTEGIYDLVPEQDDIERAVENSPQYSELPVFIKTLDVLRNDIYKSFEEVSTEVLHPLQEQLKIELIDALFNQGKMGRIRLDNDGLDDSPSQQWLKCLIDEKVNETDYPELREALKFILDYNLSIDGLIEYNVHTSIGNIETANVSVPFMPLGDNASISDKARHIRQEVKSRLAQVEDGLKRWRQSFALIPSHSFYARVNKFLTKMVYTEKDVSKKMDFFYLENAVDIWNEVIAAAKSRGSTYSQWNDVCQRIGEVCKQSKFSINKETD